MSAFHLKLIALISMVIDHIGMIFFPEAVAFRVIGRLAFPIFAWLVAEGAVHTHRMDKYIGRMLGYGILAQMPYLLAGRVQDPEFFGLNILFTFAVALIVIAVGRTSPYPALWVLPVGIGASIAEVLHMDYGIFGILAVIFFYVFRDNERRMLTAITALFVLPYPLFIAAGTFANLNDLSSILESLFLFFATLSLGLIVRYNGTQGHNMGRFFYLAYPGHFLILVGLWHLLNKIT
jgi:hypothetical protein